MERKKTQKSPTEVDAITHKETRANIPTADAHDLVSPEVEEVVEVAYPREIRSPMLVWKGKEELDDQDLQVDAPPIYIQEKIDPRVLIENLRKTAAAGELEPEMTLFDTFDGLSELDLVEFYKHSANWSNRMILGDSLQVMASLAERERLRGKVQMIYVDPPYGIKFGSNWQVSARRREVRDGNASDVAREVEQVKAFRDTWELGIHSYLSYLRDRLRVARDLLTNSGSLFLQIGDENVHLARALLDEVFGPENYVTTIIVKKKSATTPTDPVNDYVLWVARDRDVMKSQPLFDERRNPDVDAKFNTLISPDGEHTRTKSLTSIEIDAAVSSGSRWARVNYPIVSQHPDPIRSRDFEMNGKRFSCGVNKQWRFGAEGQMERLAVAHRLFDGGGKSLGGVVYWDDWPYTARSNIWEDFHGEPDPIYVVQTNRKIVERCLLMTTNPGDLVLDPTCGSGTTAYVAEHWGRRWITVDSSRVALALARQRIVGAEFPFFLLTDSDEGRSLESSLTGKSLPPALVTNDIRHGFVYERVPRMALKSIANNPDIAPGMSREELEAAIARHAEQRVLHDKPYKDTKKVRVTGPFTVESLSPHRSLAGINTDRASTGNQSRDDGGSSFEQTILENLRIAGVQNGRKAERLEFDLVESYAGTHVQAIGIREEVPEGAPKRVGVSIGPQYGTVAPSFVKNAAREASKDKDLDLLCILAFAFDPQVLNTDEDYVAADESFDVAGKRSLGRIPVLLVRMNADLLMGEQLKKTSTGNLFTVFGEPDIAIKEENDEIVIELLGVDVYDPTTGEVRSDQTDKVALWMIDTDYDEESFFVRHCYFTGGQDPYKRLKRALKADIDEEAWATLYQTVSRPFPKPSTGKIAVKVINDYGDEVVKVYDVA